VLGSPGPGSFEHGHGVDSTLRQERRSRIHNGKILGGQKLYPKVLDVSLEIPITPKELL
jgi:hypothetical protein